MYGLNLKSTPFVGSKTLIQRALSILRRPGITANVYLPGIGTLSGLNAATYLLSDGSTGNTTVDGVTGLVLDGMGSVGSELVTNGDFSNGITGWTNTSTGTGTATVASGQLNLYRLDSGNAGKVLQSIGANGLTYLVTFTVVSGTAFVSISGSGGNYGVGSYYFYWTATGTGLYIENPANASTCVVDNISVKQVTGIHATQTTTASKPRLERGVRNLLTYSQDFTNAAWIKVASTITTGQPDPLGGTNATALFETVAISLHQIEQTPAAVTSGVPYTVYAIVKDIGRGYFGLYENGSGKGNFYSIPADGSGAALGALVSAPTGASITSMGNGWYLAALNITTISTTLKAQVLTAQNATTFNYAGDVAKGLYVYRAGATAGTLTAAQILNEGGIPLTTTAAASNPASGKYSWAFDGGDSLALGSVPFVGTDDFAVLSCVHPTIVNSRDFFSIGSTSLANPLSRIGVDASNYATFFLRDDAAVSLSITDNVAISTPTVISARKVGAAVVLRTNGTQRGTNSTAIGATTFNSAAIGQRAIATPSSWWTGSTGPILAIKGTLTDSELLTLERLVSNLTPNGPTF